MKIIDLLNKIANGEEVPKKIKYDEMIFEYQGSDWLCKKNGWWFITSDDKILENLNDEVEILDEEDEFEDIVEYGKPVLLELQCEDIKLRDLQSYMYLLAKDQNTLIKNQKKIIDKLNKE
mgnify:CR=1 FL=1